MKNSRSCLIGLITLLISPLGPIFIQFLSELNSVRLVYNFSIFMIAESLILDIFSEAPPPTLDTGAMCLLWELKGMYLLIFV